MKRLICAIFVLLMLAGTAAPAALAAETSPLVGVPKNETNLLNTVTNVALVKEAELAALLAGQTLPSGVLVEADGALTEARLDAVYDACLPKSVIPGVFLASQADVEVLTGWCQKKDFWDIHIASTQADLLKAVREKHSVLRTILQVEDISGLSAQALRAQVRGCAANTLLIPADQATKAAVSGIQDLHVTVWALGRDIDLVDAAWMIASGANGVVSDSPETILNAMMTVFAENTLTKTPAIIGHRGNPSAAPENSISGYKTAVANGATEVETDIYFTADKQIIIMHDNTLNRTTDYTGSKTISEMTLEEIKACHLRDTDGIVTDETVPTLEEMFQALADYPVYYVIELKSGDEEMLEPLYELIQKYKVEGRVNLISFSGDVLLAAYRHDPILSSGLLTDNLRVSGGFPKELQANAFEIIRLAQSKNSTVNLACAFISREFYQLLNDRGLSLWPWTFGSGNTNLFFKAFTWGVDGLTTDYAQYTRNALMDVDAKLPGTEPLAQGSAAALEISAVTFNREAVDPLGKTNVVWIENDIGAAFDAETNSIVAGKQGGTATFMVSVSHTLENGQEYHLYTQPMTVTVSAEGGAGTSPAIFIVAGLVVAAAATALVLVLLRKKKA